MPAFHDRAIETSGTTDPTTQRHCPHVGRPPLVGVRDSGFSTLAFPLPQPQDAPSRSKRRRGE